MGARQRGELYGWFYGNGVNPDLAPVILGPTSEEVKTWEQEESRRQKEQIDISASRAESMAVSRNFRTGMTRNVLSGGLLGQMSSGGVTRRTLLG